MQPETCRSGIPESSILSATRVPAHEAAPTLHNHVVHKRRVARRDDVHALRETCVKRQFPSLISFQWSTGPPCCFDSDRGSFETTRIDAAGPESPARCGLVGPAKDCRLPALSCQFQALLDGERVRSACSIFLVRSIRAFDSSDACHAPMIF